MLTEFVNVRQVPGEPKRRWFSDDNFELIVWLNENGKIIGFQLAYDKEKNMRALTWKDPSSYFHHRVDDGEDHPLKPKGAPILVPDGAFDYETIAKAFQKESQSIDRPIAEFVYTKILGFGRSKVVT